VNILTRIRPEYAPLVRLNSKFLNAGGIDIRIGLFKGAQISTQSAQTLLSGGIEFATPQEIGPAAMNGAVFDLNETPKDAWKEWAPVIPLQLSGQARGNIPPLESKLRLE
jgi:paraquat-inducible protein B